MSLSPSRSLFLLASFASMLVVGGALYLEHGIGLEPCPLSIVQRLCLIAFGLVCLAASVHGPGLPGRRVYGSLGLLASASGIAAAGRQIWLQDIPTEERPECLPDLDALLARLPFQGLVRLVLHGTANCAEVNWTLFGLSVPEWSLLAFIAFFLLSLYQSLRRR